MSLVASAGSVAALQVQSLRCEDAVNPMGVDVQQPHLSWIVESGQRNQNQTGYEIQAATSLQKLAAGDADLWHSGKIATSDTLRIAYAGKPLTTAQEVFWKVRAWDSQGTPSPWSAAARWTMGVLNPADWKAHWIAAPPVADTGSSKPWETVLLRHTFHVTAHLKRALVFLCGLGQVELSINGHRQADDLLTPGWTNYKKTCLYDTHDITAQLRAGKNAIGLLLGTGMYDVHEGRYTKFTGTVGPLTAICLLRLEYADGTVTTLGTNREWKAARGPITFSSIYGGEDYDARLLPSGWDTPDVADSSWHQAITYHGPCGALRGIRCAAPPIRAIATLYPVSKRSLTNNLTVVDLGQNASIMPRLTVQGAAGSTVTITGAELLHPDGTVNRSSVGGGEAYWKYTLSGNGIEHYFPKFFYQGCRYLQVQLSAPEGKPMPVIDSLTGTVIGSSAEATGSFHCSNALFNRIYTLVRWAQRSNLVSVITDCPHRERLGWLEQTHLNGPALRYNFDLNRLFAKVENDMADSQTPEGLIPDIAPEYVVFSDGFRDSPEWGAAFCLVPWQQYLFTGDSSLLSRTYAQMERYVAYLSGKAKGHILGYGLGDWYDIGPNSPGYAQLTPVALTATAFYYQDVAILAQSASLLGKSAEAHKYAAIAEEIKAAFNATFWNESTQQYATGSDTANAIPLVMGLAPDAKKRPLVDAIVAYIQSRDNSFTAGDVGYRYVLQALAEGGRSDVIFSMNNQSTRPGYGMQLAKGATSLTEAWDANPNSSQNHFMLGQINEWFYQSLAGIQFDPHAPGFKHILIAPTPVGDVDAAFASYKSVRGPITVAWERKGTHFTLHLTIPANTTATVALPATDPESVRERGRRLTPAEGIRFLHRSGDRNFYSVASGNYKFTSD